MSFDEVFAIYEQSPWLRTQFGATLDSELPGEVQPFSFVTRDGLGEVATALAMRPGETLIDVACGRGGPGLWLARESGTVLIGVDSSAVGVAQASTRAGRFGLDGRARFMVGDFAGTGLPDMSGDGAVCVDAFQFAADPVAAGREVLRVLRPGRRFVLTTWEPHQRGDAGLPERFRDLDVARVLATAGFTSIEVHERPVWDRQRRAVYDAALAAGDPGIDKGLAMLRDEARQAAAWHDRLRRILAIALTPHR